MWVLELGRKPDCSMTLAILCIAAGWSSLCSNFLRSFVRQRRYRWPKRPVRWMALLRVLAKNPLEAWTAAHFEQAVVVSGLFIGRVAVVSDPAAIHRVLFENCDILENDSTGVIGCPLTVAGRNWGTPHSKTV